jgi:hypothetical protein
MKTIMRELFNLSVTQTLGTAKKPPADSLILKAFGDRGRIYQHLQLQLLLVKLLFKSALLGSHGPKPVEKAIVGVTQVHSENQDSSSIQDYKG